MFEYNNVKDASELRKLIAENPELPIVVLVGREAACDEYGYTYCHCVSCRIDEILDCEVPYNNELVESDRENFEEMMADWLCDQDGFKDMTDEEFEIALKAEIAKYEPYWKKCICILADN